MYVMQKGSLLYKFPLPQLQILSITCQQGQNEVLSALIQTTLLNESPHALHLPSLWTGTCCPWRIKPFSSLRWVGINGVFSSVLSGAGSDSNVLVWTAPNFFTAKPLEKNVSLSLSASPLSSQPDGDADTELPRLTEPLCPEVIFPRFLICENPGAARAPKSLVHRHNPCLLLVRHSYFNG